MHLPRAMSAPYWLDIKLNIEIPASSEDIDGISGNTQKHCVASAFTKS